MLNMPQNISAFASFLYPWWHFKRLLTFTHLKFCFFLGKVFSHKEFLSVSKSHMSRMKRRPLQIKRGMKR